MLPLNNNQTVNAGYQPAGASPASAAPKVVGPSTYAKVLDMLTVFASKWYWFILCIALGLAGSYIYLQVTPPVYHRLVQAAWLA